MSFYEFDATWLYREVFIIPLAVIVLWFFWMRIVRKALKDAVNEPVSLSLEEAYADAIINDALDTGDEEEEEEEDEALTKSDLNAPSPAQRKEDLNEPTEAKKNL